MAEREMERNERGGGLIEGKREWITEGKKGGREGESSDGE